MSQSSIRVSLITPTYNERENLPLLAEEIFQSISSNPEIDLELIVVDDNSPDGTGDIADSLTEGYPLKVIHRAGKLGLGSAVMEGFQASDREYLGVIDADLSHDPSLIPRLIGGLSSHDIMIGSRYNPESRVEKWPWYRKLISQTGVAFAKMITGVDDPLSGYFFLHRDVIAGISLTSHGYKILLEILVKGTYSTYQELPYVFRNREFSTSKLNLGEYILFAKQILVFTSLKMKARLGARNRP